MKVILIMMQSIDGFIWAPALDKKEKSWWGSKEDIKFFKKKSTEVGTLILGNTTFKTMSLRVFENRFGLIFTKNPEKYKNQENSNIKFFKGSPSQAVDFLESIGKKTAVLAGGGSINGQFLKAGLINEIFLTVTPKIFGKGTKLFEGICVDKNLKLLNIKKIAKNEILTHWKVL